MAYISPPKSLLLSLLVFFVAIAPLGHGITIGGITGITQIRIDGFVACSATGNPPSVDGGVVGVAGVLVSGRCNGLSIDLGTAKTNATGFFSIFIDSLDGILFDEGSCYAVIQLPVTDTTCTAFLSTGILQAPLTLLDTVQNLLGGILEILKAGTYQHLPL